MTVQAAVPARGVELRGIGLYTAAILLLSVMDALIKWTTDHYPVVQIVAFRSVIGLLPILVVLAWRRRFHELRTRRPLIHVVRGVIGVSAGFCFFYAFKTLPLVDAYAIAFASPLFITALSVPVLGEAVGPRRWTAVAVGFVGILVILRPGIEGIDQFLTLGGLAALAGTFLFALSVLLIRRFGRTETSAAMVLWSGITGAVIASVVSLPDFVAPDALGWGLMGSIGLLGGVATIMLTEAFRTARPAVLAPFEYTAMIWAVIFGLTIWGDVPDIWVGVGSAIVIAAGLYILHRERRRDVETAGSERLAAAPLAAPQGAGDKPAGGERED